MLKLWRPLRDEMLIGRVDLIRIAAEKLPPDHPERRLKPAASGTRA
jgi:hypothetical protein